MILLPDTDVPTHSASGFLIRYVVPRVQPSPSLYGALDRKVFFDQLVSFGDVIIGVGHGEPDLFGGQGEEILLQVGKYDPSKVRGKFIKLISCQTADFLGPDLIKNGAIAYQGYTEDYLWVADLDYGVNPWDDLKASRCLLPVMKSLDMILDGHTNKEAFEVEKKGYEENLSVEEDELIKSFLRWNRDSLTMLGESGARIGSKPDFILPIPPPPFFPIRSPL